MLTLPLKYQNLGQSTDSQPTVNGLPLGNLMLSAAILISGSQISQVLRLLHTFNIQMYCRDTFQRHQVRTGRYFNVKIPCTHILDNFGKEISLLSLLTIYMWIYIYALHFHPQDSYVIPTIIK